MRGNLIRQRSGLSGLLARGLHPSDKPVIEPDFTNAGALPRGASLGERLLIGFSLNPVSGLDVLGSIKAIQPVGWHQDCLPSAPYSPGDRSNSVRNFTYERIKPLFHASLSETKERLGGRHAPLVVSLTNLSDFAECRFAPSLAAVPYGSGFIAQTPDELRRQANKLYEIAAHVCRLDVAAHLEEQAAALLAEAEIQAAAALK